MTSASIVRCGVANAGAVCASVQIGTAGLYRVEVVLQAAVGAIAADYTVRGGGVELSIPNAFTTLAPMWLYLASGQAVEVISGNNGDGALLVATMEQSRGCGERV